MLALQVSDYLSPSPAVRLEVPSTLRAACGLSCQLQVDKWELGSVPSQGSAATAAGRWPASAPLSTRMGLHDYLSPSPTVRVPGQQAG